MNIHNIAKHLNELGDNSSTGLQFDCYPIDGDISVLQVNIVNREEIPIFVSITESQILCISYLWGEDEIKQDRRTSMLETMLELNIPMPLSSFAKIDDKYALFGALSLQSSMLEIEQELAVLSDNCLEVIDELVEFFN